MKIKDRSRKCSPKLDGIGVGKIRRFPFPSDSAYDCVAFDPMKTRSSESEAEAEEPINHNASECSPNHMAASCLDKKVAQVVRRFPLLYDKCYKDFNETNKKKNARKDVPKQNGYSSGTLNCRSERTPKVQEISQLLGVNPFLFLFGLELGMCLLRETAVKTNRDWEEKMKAWFFG